MSDIAQVYLDQNAWIGLARAHYRGEDPHGALESVRNARKSGVAFPLSGGHYIETLRRGDPASRRRLAQFMFDIADMDRITSAPHMLDTEIRSALEKLLGAPRPTNPQRPFGRGVAHAFPQGEDFMKRPVIAAAAARFGRDMIERDVELELLRGPDTRLPAFGIARPDDTFDTRQRDHEMAIRRRLIEHGHTSDLAHRLILTEEASGLVTRVNALIDELRIDIEPIMSKQGITDFLFSMPALAAITRMRMTAHENTQFRWARGDLNDLTSPGMAAAYCDIVVCENHWGSILRRHQNALRARVLTSLRDLPQALKVEAE